MSTPFRSQLIDWLTLLAAPAETQTQFLRTNAFPNADELALWLHDLVILAPQKVASGEMSTRERDCVTKLSQQLDAISGAQNAHLWQVEALAAAEGGRVFARVLPNA